MQKFSPSRFRAERESREVTREQVAVASGKSGPTIAAYELGRLNPPLPVLSVIADFIGVDIADLFVDDVEVMAS